MLQKLTTVQYENSGLWAVRLICTQRTCRQVPSDFDKSDVATVEAQYQSRPFIRRRPLHCSSSFVAIYHQLQAAHTTQVRNSFSVNINSLP